MKNGTWAVLTEDIDEHYLKGHIGRIIMGGWDPREFPRPLGGVILTGIKGRPNIAVDRNKIMACGLAESYAVIYSARNGNEWSEPRAYTSFSLDDYRADVTDLEDNPNHYIILAKKKFMTPYDPQLIPRRAQDEAIDMQPEPVDLGAVRPANRLRPMRVEAQMGQWAVNVDPWNAQNVIDHAENPLNAPPPPQVWNEAREAQLVQELLEENDE